MNVSGDPPPTWDGGALQQRLSAHLDDHAPLGVGPVGLQRGAVAPALGRCAFDDLASHRSLQGGRGAVAGHGPPLVGPAALHQRHGARWLQGGRLTLGGLGEVCAGQAESRSRPGKGL